MTHYKSIATLNFESLTSTKHTITLSHHNVDEEDAHLFLSDEIEIEKVLGQGGMGTVYLAQQKCPERDVAIKRSNNDLPHFHRALIQEAMITGALEHPNIVPIHELTLDGPNGPEVVMKRVLGRTLQRFDIDKIQDDEQLRQAIGWMIQVCNALQFAHEKNIIHRDIKPDNIMIGDYGEVYVLDWGIAIHLERAKNIPIGMVGSPAYMAPEMLSGDSTDISIHTDVYLVGATLHELLVGQPRHVSFDYSQIFELVEASVPFTYSEHIPEELAQICNKACHVNKEERFQSISELKGALIHFLKFREVNKMYNAACEEVEKLQQIFEKEESSQENTILIFEHYSNARFAYEYTLNIHTEHVPSTKGLEELFIMMVNHYLDKGDMISAKTILLQIENPPQQLLEAYEKAKESIFKTEEEHSRIFNLGKSIDAKNSRRYRSILTGMVLLLAAGLMVLVMYVGTNEITISNQDLMLQGMFFIVPIALILYFGRETLLNDRIGRQATVGIVGSIIGIVLTRWAGLELDIPPSQVLVFEKIVVAMGFANTPPVIPSGMLIALLFILSGVGSVVWIDYQWVFDLSSIVFLFFFLGKDYLLDIRHRINKED